MGRRLAKSSVRAILEGQIGSTSSVPQQKRPGTHRTPEALLAFAEEFGRTVARQLLADPNDRRGYGVPVGMIGLTFNSGILLLVYYLMTLFRR